MRHWIPPVDNEARHEAARCAEAEEDNQRLPGVVIPRHRREGRSDRSAGGPGSEQHPRQHALSPAERAALYEQLQPLVGRLIRQYGTSPDLREELPGEIYCRFVRLLEAYDPAREIPLKPYLIRSLPPAVYSWARSRWRLQQREVVAPEGEETLGPASADPTPEWDAALLMRGLLEQLPTAIAALPERQRQVVIARYYEGRSFDEIAAAMAIQPVSARSLLRFGIEGLRRQLGPCRPRDG